jgi:hypothetical protein
MTYGKSGASLVEVSAWINGTFLVCQAPGLITENTIYLDLIILDIENGY